MELNLQILRQAPDAAPYSQTFRLDISPRATVLDCLNQIKWSQDGTLAFRKNCRNTICGSCGMRINGRAALACQNSVANELKQSLQPQTITIAPLGNLPVVRDLIVDMQPFWQNLDDVNPYVSPAARSLGEGEFRQTPGQRAKLNEMGNCIMCGACYSDCNGKEVNPEFVGPHALAKAYRMLADNRDQTTDQRLEEYNSTAGVWGCTRCFNCNTVCPMDVAPLDQISKIKGEILTQAQGLPAPRPIRHRQVLVDLVKRSGWVDERKFGLEVVGNKFRDLRGLLSLLPLGWRMVQRGKFPMSFEKSAGQAQVQGLIESVQSLEKNQAHQGLHSHE